MGAPADCASSGDIETALCCPLFDVSIDPGDQGYRIPLCDCPSDCAAGDCIGWLDHGEPVTVLGRAGFCDQMLEGDSVLNCD